MSRNAKNALHFRSAQFASLMFSTVLAGTFGMTSTAAIAACTDSPNSTVCTGSISNAETLEGSGMLFYVQQSEVYEGGDFSLILNNATLADGSLIVTGPRVAAEDSEDGDEDVEPLAGSGSITLNGTSSVASNVAGDDDDADLAIGVLAIESSSITLNGTSSVMVTGQAADFAVGGFSPGTVNITTAAATSITNEALGELERVPHNGHIDENWRNSNGIVAEGHSININVAGTVTAQNGTAIRVEAGEEDDNEEDQDDDYLGGNVSIATSNTIIGRTQLPAEDEHIDDYEFLVGGIIAETNGGNTEIEATGAVTGFIAIGGRTADGDVSVKTGAGNISGTVFGVGAQVRESGDITIETGTGIVSALESESHDTGFGIVARTGDDRESEIATGGNINITTKGDVIGARTGIGAWTKDGDVTVTTAAGKAVGSAGFGDEDPIIADGIKVESGHNGYTDAGQWLEGGGGAVTVNANGIVGGTKSGINAWSREGSVTVNTGAGSQVAGENRHGIQAQTGYVEWSYETIGELVGPIDFRSGGGGDVLVNALGELGGEEHGVNAWSREGTATVKVGATGKVGGLINGVSVGTGFTESVGPNDDTATLFHGGGGTSTVEVAGGGAVKGTEHGISAWTLDGEVIVKTGAGSEVLGETEAGIDASAAWGDQGIGQGNVTVTADGKVTGNWAGINSWTLDGNVSVTTGVASEIVAKGVEGNGIQAGAGREELAGSGGNVTVVSNGKVTGGHRGIDAFTDLGNSNVTVGAGAIVEGSSDRGASVGTRSGTARATIDGKVTGASDGVAVFSDDGNISVVTGAASEIIAKSDDGDGIQAGAGLSEMAGSGGDVTVVANGKVTGGHRGIEAYTESGKVDVNVGAGALVEGRLDRGASVGATSGMANATIAGKVKGKTDGVAVYSDDIGDATAVLASTTIVEGVTGSGVDVYSQDGDALVVADGKIKGGQNGVIANSATASAKVEVASSSAEITAENEGHGIAVFAKADATAIVNGTVKGDANGVAVSAHNNALVKNAGKIVGDGQGVHMSAYGKRDLINQSSGFILNSSGLFDAAAVEVVNFADEDIVAANVLNDGRIDGRINAYTFANITNVGVWNTLGYSNADNGAVINSGTINAAHAGSNVAESTELNSYTFANSGLISLIDSLVGSGNKDNDELVIAGNYAGGGSIGLNAYLDSSATSSADTVYFGGDVTGSTVLRVVNTNANGGALIDEANGDGIILAIVAGDVQANAFALEGDVISTGLFDYYLLKDTVSGEDGEMASFELFSRPNNGSAAEAPVVSAAVESVVQSGINPWLDRQLDLRSSVAGGPTITAAADTGPSETSHMGTFWMEGIGGRVDHSGTSRFNNVNVDVGFKQSLYGLTGGADFGQRLSSGGTMLFGVFGSYVTSDIKFAARTNGMKMNGYSVGGYATLMQSNFFASAMVKGDFLDLSHSVGAASGSTDVTSFAFRGDAGYTHKMGNLSIEPLATVVVQNTGIDGYSVGLATFAGSDSEQLAIAGGLRGTVKMDGAAFTLTGRVWKDLSDDDQVDVSFGSAPSSSAVSSGVFGGVYSEIAASGAFSLTDQVSVYGGGTVKFDSDTTAKSAFGGVNFSW
jgi:autotransporter family porin